MSGCGSDRDWLGRGCTENKSSPREWPGHAMASMMWRYLLSTPALLRVFIISVCSILLNVFSASLEMIV